MALRMDHAPDSDDLSTADQFQSHARLVAKCLVVGALVAVALGLALASLNVWEQHEQFGSFGDQQFSFRFYILGFFSLFSLYALISAVLLAGGLVVNSLAWFQLALSEDFDDLYDAAAGEVSPAAGSPSPGSRDRQQSAGSDSYDD